MRTSSGLLWTVLAAILLTGSGQRLQARQWPAEVQSFGTGTYWAVGYATNAPHQFLGFSTLLFGAGLRQWGLYIDTKSSLDTPKSERGYSLELTPADAEALGDYRANERSAWRSVNLALVRVVGPALALYLGGGYSNEEAYARYLDFEGERGYLGHYWVRDAGLSGRRLNLLGGAWLRITPHILFQFGGEVAPGGFTAGVSYAFPLRR